MVVLDANVALAASTQERGFEVFGHDELIAPPLMWPEARSALHVSRWRGLISGEVAERSLSLIESGRIGERRHRRLGTEAWRIADEFGWSKTYDAEYLALALLLKTPIVTLDRRVQRAAELLRLEADTRWR